MNNELDSPENMSQGFISNPDRLQKTTLFFTDTHLNNKMAAAQTRQLSEERRVRCINFPQKLQTLDMIYNRGRETGSTAARGETSTNVKQTLGGG